MKNNLLIFLLFFLTVIYSQKKEIKKFETLQKTIHIAAFGLDDIVIENSDTNFIEVLLFAENTNRYHILIGEKKESLYLSFQLLDLNEDEPIFRKFITKRLFRANVVVKIPAHKNVELLGDNCHITANAYRSNLDIQSSFGVITVNGVAYKKRRQLNNSKWLRNLTIKSNKGNITINTLKIQ